MRAAIAEKGFVAEVVLKAVVTDSTCPTSCLGSSGVINNGGMAPLGGTSPIRTVRRGGGEYNNSGSEHKFEWGTSPVQF